ncbi:MAG: hypothetical protein IPM85_00085 [Chitinophagaceae bacterium]|nr:hypothetical protein [Chitinophagaceae bacterium]
MKKKNTENPVARLFKFGCPAIAAVLLVLLSLPLYAGYSISPNASINDTIPPVKNKIQKIAGQVQLLGDSLPKPPVFKIQNIGELKKQTANLRLMKPLPVTVQPVALPNTGNAAYKSGTGVTLNPLGMRHMVTKSVLFLYNVAYSSTIAVHIKNNTPFSIWQTYNVPAGASVLNRPLLFATASFNDLPTNPHTYLLTLGTSAASSITRISIFNNDYTSSIVFEGDDLIKNEASSEIRLLFGYDKIVKGTYGTYGMTIRIEYKSPNPGGYSTWFNHIQLLQLD